jgi:hypothetical protein
MSSGRSFESDTITNILLFKDFDSGLIPSDSDLSESYMKYAHQTRSQSNDMVLPKMQCFHLFRGVWHYHTQREYQNLQAVPCKKFLSHSCCHLGENCVFVLCCTVSISV